MPVRFEEPTEFWSSCRGDETFHGSGTTGESAGATAGTTGCSGEAIVRELFVQKCAEGDEHDVSIKIRILPRKMTFHDDVENPTRHNYHHHHPQQQHHVTSGGGGGGGGRAALQSLNRLKATKKKEKYKKVRDASPRRPETPANSSSSGSRGGSLRQHIASGLRSTFAKRSRLNCWSSTSEATTVGAGQPYGYHGDDGDVTFLSATSASAAAALRKFYSCSDDVDVVPGEYWTPPRANLTCNYHHNQQQQSVKFVRDADNSHDFDERLDYSGAQTRRRLVHADQVQSTVDFRFQFNVDDDPEDLEDDLFTASGSENHHQQQQPQQQRSAVAELWLKNADYDVGPEMSRSTRQVDWRRQPPQLQQHPNVASPCSARPLVSIPMRRIQPSCTPRQTQQQLQQQQQQQLKCRPRRVLTEFEEAEIADYPEVYYAGDFAAVIQRGAETARSRASCRQTTNDGVKNNSQSADVEIVGSSSQHHEQKDTPSCYDDKDGFYIHIPHDHVAYRYEVFKVLGRGSFGEVVRAFDHKHHRWVAVKIVRSEERFRRQAADEVRMLRLLREADGDGRGHVVRMLDHFDFRNHPCIVFECLGVDLYEALRRRNFRGFPMGAARRAAVGIARCLAVLRQHGIIHCDLKPENVLLTLMPSMERSRSGAARCNVNVKVVDFGSSCFENDKLFVYVQSRFYRAPEVILGAGYGTSVDMWSLGCIVAELVTGKPLFSGDDEGDQFISQLEYLGMPPTSLLARSKRTTQFFHTSTGHPRYCSTVSGPCEVASGETVPPQLTGSTNRSGKYRGPPGSRDLKVALLKIAGREPGAAFHRRHSEYVDFVRRCLFWEPSYRMTPDEALRHSWLLQDPTTARSRTAGGGMSSRTPRVVRPGSHGDENVFS